MRKSKPTDHRLETARRMPPLKRRANPQTAYDPDADQVLAWIGANNQLQNYLFDLLNRLGYIKYNQKTGAWSGMDHAD